MNWIDAHAHVWSPDTTTYPRWGPLAAISPLSFTPAQLLSIARPCDVVRVVLVQMSFYRQDHRFLIESLRQYPGVFAAIALADPESPDPAGQMRRLAAQGVRGFRISTGTAPQWLQTDAMRAIWRCAAERGFAICPLLSPESLPALGAMCAAHRNATVVIDHLARIGMASSPDEQSIAALCALARYPRVYVKVSAFYALGRKIPPYEDLAPLLRRVVEAFGPERLMWGSDSPFQAQPPHTYRASLELVRDHLPFLKEQDRCWLLGKTAEGLFFPTSC